MHFTWEKVIISASFRLLIVLKLSKIKETKQENKNVGSSSSSSTGLPVKKRLNFSNLKKEERQNFSEPKIFYKSKKFENKHRKRIISNDSCEIVDIEDVL